MTETLDSLRAILTSRFELTGILSSLKLCVLNNVCVPARMAALLRPYSINII